MIVEAGLILLNILCYGDIRWLLLEQILLFPCFNVLKRKKREKEKHLYEKGFQNLLQSMMTSLQAGYSLNNSCRIALKELEELYQDQNNPMLRQMRRIIQGLDLHITLEQLFMEFAESTGLEEAKQFAVVIEIVRSTGGTTGQLMIPTAEMQETGTFMGGVNFLPEQVTPSVFSFPTMNYFVDMTLFSFIEFTYRIRTVLIMITRSACAGCHFE